MRILLHHLLAALFSATTALSHSIPRPQTPFLTHSSSNRTVSPALFTDLEEFARIVDITYCVGLTSLGINKPFRCLSRCKDFPSFTLVTTWNTGPLLSDSCGYIALDHGKKRVIVAFRGTYSIANTVVDLSTVPQEYVPYPEDGDDVEDKCRKCTVHMGFHTAWMHTRDRILDELLEQVYLYPDYRLNLVGHSLGGAVAALAALDLQGRDLDPVVTTFGEPRIGNKNLVRFIDERFNVNSTASRGDSEDEDDMKLTYRRVTHIDDPVPLLPVTEWGFAMHAGEIFISKPSLSPDISDLHLCRGDNDQSCIAGQDSTTLPSDSNELPSSSSDSDESPQILRTKRDLISSVAEEVHEVVNEPWGIPSRYKLWQLFFSHRDYFWRLGLCVPGGDPLGGGEKYEPELDEDGFKGELRR